jgi:hypothetical protein
MLARTPKIIFKLIGTIKRPWNSDKNSTTKPMSISPTFKITTDNVYFRSSNMPRLRNKQSRHLRHTQKSMVNMIRNWRRFTIIWWRSTSRTVTMSVLGIRIRNPWIFRRWFMGTIMILIRASNFQHLSSQKRWNSHLMVTRANMSNTPFNWKGSWKIPFRRRKRRINWRLLRDIWI